MRIHLNPCCQTWKTSRFSAPATNIGYKSSTGRPKGNGSARRLAQLPQQFIRKNPRVVPVAEADSIRIIPHRLHPRDRQRLRLHLFQHRQRQRILRRAPLLAATRTRTRLAQLPHAINSPLTIAPLDQQAIIRRTAKCSGIDHSISVWFFGSSAILSATRAAPRGIAPLPSSYCSAPCPRAAFPPAPGPAFP